MNTPCGIEIPVKKQNKATDIGLGMIAGIAAGLVVGTLYAPKPGSQTKTAIKEKASAVKEQAEAIVEKVRPRTSDLVLVVREGCIEPVEVA